MTFFRDYATPSQKEQEDWLKQFKQTHKKVHVSRDDNGDIIEISGEYPCLVCDKFHRRKRGQLQSHPEQMCNLKLAAGVRQVIEEST